MDRTLMSAEANLAGLFTPHGDEIWNRDLLWQPIPIHTVPFSKDYILAANTTCPKYDDLYKKYMAESPEVQRIYTEYGPLFKYLSRMAGQNVSTITDIYFLFDALNIEKEQHKPLVRNFLPFFERMVDNDAFFEIL